MARIPRPPRHTSSRDGDVVGDTLLRAVLLFLVIAFASALFALALLPAVAAGGRAIDEFTEDFTRIGSDVDLSFPRIPERSTIYAADGSVLATLYLDENREYVRLRSINRLARKAVLAIEDARFYEHEGLDLMGVARALVANITAGEIEQGASTITQQLARNVFPRRVGTERTLTRKIEEARVAMRLEQEYSKDEILELYLNEVYFGRGVYGIGTAAEYYFGTPAKRLSLPQAAMLAGLIAAPETYSPINDRDAAIARRNVVLSRLLDLEMIGDRRAERATGSRLGLDVTDIGNRRARFPYFVEYIKQQILHDPRLRKTFGETYRQRKRALFQGGLQIFTTLEPGLQDAGERIVRERLPSPSDPEAAIAAVETETGAIQALVGGADFGDSQVNLATGQGGSGRQAGSAFKPFTLAAAFEQDVPVGAVYDGASGQHVDCGAYGGDYQVFNAESGSPGAINLLTATAKSVNAVFVQLAADVGPPAIVDVAHRMGIRSDLPEVCSLTLGTAEVSPLEMAAAFTPLATGGMRCDAFAISRVETRTGRELFRHEEDGCERALSREVADKVAGMLRLVVSEGTGTAANLGTWPVFGKTGTTNDSADLWFDGCTRQICAATWVGHPEGRVAMPGLYGGTVAAPIWHDFMQVAMRGLPALPLPEVPRPERAPVPDVVGMDREEAIETLIEAFFRANVEQVPSEEPRGVVVGQSPTGGTRATTGTAVTIRVSNGEPPAIPVPNVVGLERGDARQALLAEGFHVSLATQVTDQRSLDGTVASQSPASGAEAQEGSNVTITVYEFERPDAEGRRGDEDDRGGGHGRGGGRHGGDDGRGGKD